MKSIPPQILGTKSVNYLTHLTLNTRHVSVRPLHSLHPMIGAGLLPTLTMGFGSIPALPGFTVGLARGQRDGLRLSIAKSGVEIAVGALVWGIEDESPAWAWLSSLFADQASVISDWRAEPPPRKPPTLPWLGVVLLPTIGTLTAEEASAVGGFEAALALAALNHLPSRK